MASYMPAFLWDRSAIAHRALGTGETVFGSGALALEKGLEAP